MAMEFPDLGQHCTVKDCHQLDFLPFRCNACSQVFCLEHRNYEQHHCAQGKRRDNQAFFCPECNASINVGYGGDVDEKLCIHLSTECPSFGFQQPAASTPSSTQSSASCIVKGCKQRSKFLGTTCKLCQKPVCLSHRFEKDHQCEKLQNTLKPHPPTTRVSS
jgi:predicted nucleic acid binding AN1-type Zn finger protein